MNEENVILQAINELNQKMENRFINIERELKDIKAEQSEMKEELVGIKAEQSEMKEELVGIKAEQSEMKEELVGIKAEQINVKIQYKSIKEIQISMEEEIKKISRSVAVMEIEHGKKLDILFDAFTMNSDNIKLNANKIKVCETRLDKHDDEIYYLNSKI